MSPSLSNITIVAQYYEQFLRSHYKKFEGLESESYTKQLSSLLESGFGDSDIYSNGFKNLGFRTSDVIANCIQLQNAWRSENTKYSGVSTLDLWLAQVIEFGARYVYFHDIGLVTKRSAAILKSRNIKLICQIASPIPRHVPLDQIDLFVTSFPHFHKYFEQNGLKSLYVPLAFDGRRAMSYKPYKQRQYRISFIGGLTTNHSNFLPQLEKIAERYSIAVFGYVDDAISFYPNLRASYQGEAWGREMYEILGDSQITINRHHAAAGDCANNLRMYEATGMGAMLVTDDKRNLSQFFHPGLEVVTYANQEQLLEVLKSAVNDPSKSEEIAERGRVRCLSSHQFSHTLPLICKGILELT